MVMKGSAMSPGVPVVGNNFELFERDLELLLRDNHNHPAAACDARDVNPYRSGSAPPTIDGSRPAAVGHLLGEEDMRAYQAYYHSKGNLNPRLPREDLRLRQRGLRKEEGDSLFSVQPCAVRDWQRQSPSRPPLQPAKWGTNGLGLQRKSIGDDALQGDFGGPIYNDMETVDNLYSGRTRSGLSMVQSYGASTSHSFSTALCSSMARSTAPDSQLFRRAPSPYLHAVDGKVSDTDKTALSNGFPGVSSGMEDHADIMALSGLKLSEKIGENGKNVRQGQLQQNLIDHSNLLFNTHRERTKYLQQNNALEVNTESSSTIPLKMYNDFSQSIGISKDVGLSTSNGQISLPKHLPSSEIYNVAAGSRSLAGSTGHYQTDRSSNFTGCDSIAYFANQGLPSTLNSLPDSGSALAVGAEELYFSRIRNQVGSGFKVPINDAPYAMSDPFLGRNYLGASVMDLQYQAYIGALLAQHKLQYGTHFFVKPGPFNNDLYFNPTLGLGIPYPSQFSGSVLSSLYPGNPLRHNDQITRIPSVPRFDTAVSMGSWNHEGGIMEESFSSYLLEELRNNNTRSFELLDIVGHVFEFSRDQYGSRFIQQKLETGSIEERNSIFPEILYHAHVLMADVFGNYVIQKFFEHGTQSQRNQLADELKGFVLQLSLQMYGCRVIQKALEMVDVDQQTQMVAELDGSIMKCVQDQNGNHVVQKCIKYVPQQRIQFIISSFYGQVVPLSTHPYGCRVIQRVLEHCDDAQTQSIMMEEILQSVCTLAHDQYGNYVVQHVLNHGKQEERSLIISKLEGQIVKMSQHKFASNVVEKCLTYGTAEERKLLIDEMLRITDENDPLQTMMKDQFGNYVVQKVLNICDDQKLELIISRIKAHLSSLMKYTYGKHIVARVEKLLTTGERRIGMSATSA